MAYFFLPVLASVMGIVPAELPAAKLDSLMGNIISHSMGSMTALIAVTVDPQGKVLDCLVSQAQGDKSMVARVCSAIEHIKFEAAVGTEGQTVHAKVELVITVGGEKALSPGPDVILKIRDFPGGERQADTHVIVVFNEKGALTSCSKPVRKDGDATLADLACQKLRSLSVKPLVTDGGAGVPYMTELAVRLVADHSASDL